MILASGGAGNINPQFLPRGMTADDYAQLNTEQQMVVQQEMLRAQQAYIAALNDSDQKGLMGESLNDMDEEIDINNPKKIIKQGKKYAGLLEWILDRDGHEFLVQVDREFLRDKLNFIGLKEQFMTQLNIPKEKLTDK